MTCFYYTSAYHQKESKTKYNEQNQKNCEPQVV